MQWQLTKWDKIFAFHISDKELILSEYIKNLLDIDKIYYIWNLLNWVCLILWLPHAKSWLIGKDSDAGRGWEQEEKGMTENEMARWHHWLDGHESEWTLGVGDGQGGLACCDSWGRKESDTTERLNWTEHAVVQFVCHTKVPGQGGDEGQFSWALMTTNQSVCVHVC